MYIALKWLLSLNFLLWLALCFNRFFHVENEKNDNATDFHCITNYIEDKMLMCLTTEMNVFAFTIYTLQIMLCGILLFISCKKLNFIVCRHKLNLEIICGHIESLKYVYYKYYTILNYFKGNHSIRPLQISKPVNFNVTNIFMLLMLKYLIEEKKKLAKTLSHFGQESKNEAKYKSDNTLLPKKRLSIAMKPATVFPGYAASYHRSFVWLLCENIFLKTYLDKLAKEKETIERDLLNIITRVLLTDDYNLKAYCSKFVVRTKEEFLKTDNMKLEVQRFLAKSTQQTLSSQFMVHLLLQNYPNA